MAEEAKKSINKALRRWRVNKKTKEDLSFPELLRDLSVVLPNDLLVHIYSDTDHKTTFDSLLNLSLGSEPPMVSVAAVLLLFRLTDCLFALSG